LTHHKVTLTVNGQLHQLQADPETPLLTILRNDLGLKSPKFGCGEEQCGACKVLVDGQAVPSCQLPVKQVQSLPIVTLEGLGTADALHPLQEAFIEEEAAQCGYCTAGMIIAAQGLLNRQRYPTDADIREALADNLCRCGVYDRVRRAIKLRIGRPEDPLYELRTEEVARPTPLAKPTPSAAPELPLPIQQTPELDAWIRIDAEETITLFSGKVDYGQGLQTALAQLGAEELDVALERVRVVLADTAQTPDEGMTVGSMSLETSGNAIRCAAAEARHIMLSVAMEELEAPLGQLVVEDGLIRDPASGRQVSYWQLFGGRKFGRLISGKSEPKAPDRRQIVGSPAKRLDLPAKVTGTGFLHDLTLPGMVYGRVVRPPHFQARLLSVDVEAAGRLPGVLRVVRDGSFLGVIAEREEQAIQAMEFLRDGARWQGQAELPPQEKLAETLLAQSRASHSDKSFLIVDGSTVEGSSDTVPFDGEIPDIEPPDMAAHTLCAHTLCARYQRPFQMHASLGPSAAVAHFSSGQLTIWTHAQGVYPLRAAIAGVLGMAEVDVRVIFMAGPGVYGHSGVDDAALDAALLAKALPGRPLSLQWTRADEHTWEPYTPAMVVDMSASQNTRGDIVDWNHEVCSPSHLGRSQTGAGFSGLLAAWHVAEPFDQPPRRPALGSHSGGHRNADPLYTFPRRRIVKHFLADSILRTSSMRGLGAYANIFAIESFMDELAHAAGVDPLEFRLRHLADERARAVLLAATEKAGWSGEKAPGRGRGLAFAQYKNRQTYAAVVVELTVAETSGEIQLERAVIAADAGQIINPDGLSNQLEGGFVQSASMTLYEQVSFDERGITSTDWESYPILPFPNAPRVETVLLNRPDRPHVGAGEASQGPTPAAIANAIFDAAGIRLREIPFRPERVKAALDRL
jgi:CO/xanthine dehydrogenase Mo-binding subunit/aerobic-type carbon monoxide dehydrogenase small subunit (CoxS/CutS family)